MKVKIKKSNKFIFRRQVINYINSSNLFYSNSSISKNRGSIVIYYNVILSNLSTEKTTGYLRIRNKEKDKWAIEDGFAGFHYIKKEQNKLHSLKGACLIAMKKIIFYCNKNNKI